MIAKPFDAIEKSDIDELVASKVREGRTIDYKLTLPGNTDKDKKEYLADVSSFANASGGDLLFGIDESGGVPVAIPGLDDPDIDAAILRLESIVRSGIEPRIPGVQTKTISGFPKGPVIVTRICRSWIAPHMVVYGGSSRFHTRCSAGKQQMDVTEIRAAFALSEAIPERMRRFRDDRLAKIVARETPVVLIPECAYVVLHMLPLSAFAITQTIDTTAISESQLPPIYHGFERTPCRRLNIDGVVTYYSAGTDLHAGYTQLFRNGAIEIVECIAASPGDCSPGAPRTIGTGYESLIVGALGKYLGLLKGLDITPPVFILTAMCGVRGCTMKVSPQLRSRAQYPIDRDVLLLPDVVVNDYSANPKAVMKPAFDAAWNAVGLRGSED